MLKLGKALVGVAQWIVCPTVNPEVAGLIPSQGTCLGCGPGPQFGAGEKLPLIHRYFSPSLSVFLSFSRKIKK